MRKIIHISDLHFGTEDKAVVNTLLQDIHTEAPNVVVASGDLTQRARRSQFKKAAHFLDQIPCAKVVVPGNHDVPLFDVTRRFLAPFNRYIRYINADFFPTYSDDYMTIIGINTAFSFTWKSGRVMPTQLKTLQEKFRQAGDKIKMLVIHHPYHEILMHERHHNDLTELGIDIVLSGHLHQASSKILENHIDMLNFKTLIVQAGTAISTRLRGESNSYNFLEVNSKNDLTIVVKEYDNLKFRERLRSTFVKENKKWCPV